MSAQDDDLVIEIEDDAATRLKAGEPEVEVEKGAKPAIRTGDEGIEDLRSKLDAANKRTEEANSRAADEARARQVAEQEAQRAAGAATRFFSEAQEARFDRANTRLESATSALAAAKAAYKSAINAGDADAMTEANAAIAEQAALRAQAERDKEAVEDEIEEAKRRMTRPAEPRREAAADPVEQAIASVADPRSRDWLRKHPDYLTDQTKNTRMQAAHFAAVAEGKSIGTDEYFESVETKLGLRQAEEDPEPARGKATTTATGRRPVAAPASRDVPSGGTVRREGSKVYLSREQADMAESLGITPQAYAKQLLRAEAEGRLGQVAGR